MADIDITFSNGSRVFTPTNPPSAPQLGDVNNDGEIDILDAGDVNAFQLTDVNNDGVIDILDAAEVLAQGPGGVTTVPPPTLTPPNPFDNPKTCPPGQTLTIIPIGNGLTTTGCTSIPSLPPTDGVAPVDGYFCEAPKVLGFGINYETGYPRYEGCVCAEASVNIADVVLTIGAGYLAWRKALADSLRSQIANINKAIDTNTKAITSADNMIKYFLDQEKSIQNKIDELRQSIRNGDDNVDWTGKPKQVCFENGTCFEGRTNGDLVNILRDSIDRLRGGTGGGSGLEPEKNMNLNFWENELARATNLLDANKGVLKNLQDALNNLLNAADPTALVTAFGARMIPISFVVPKECGAFSRLDDQCNCVPISSGSYSYSSLTNQSFKNKDYTIIENL
jgi:hypothetical protein